MRFRDLKCRNKAQNRNQREKLSKTGPVEKFWLWSKSTVNGLIKVKVNGQQSSQSQWLGQQLRMLTRQCDVTLRLMWQYVKRSRRVGRVKAREGSVPSAWVACERWMARGSVWRHVERVLMRQKLQTTHGGACEVVSGSSLLGFARDRKICQSVPWLWQFNQQNWQNPGVLGAVGMTAVTRFWQYYWMKAMAVEERRRYPQEPENQRNDSDTMLTI